MNNKVFFVFEPELKGKDYKLANLVLGKIRDHYFTDSEIYSENTIFIKNRSSDEIDDYIKNSYYIQKCLKELGMKKQIFSSPNKIMKWSESTIET